MNGNFIDEEEVLKTIDKLDVEITNEKLNLDNIITIIQDININYKTDNESKLSELLDTLNNKFKTITAIHDDNITVLKKNLDTYISTREKIANMFDDLA